MTTSTTLNNYGISWKDFSVWSQKKIPQGIFRRQKVQRVRLLNSVSGYARAGSMTAIMGASGAGKTTLLAALSCRASGFETEGVVLLNGRPINTKHMISISEFMPQHFLTVGGLTVFEHLQFMACLKMDVRVSEIERSWMVENSLSDFGLRECKDSQLRLLSGGERRRVALAVHLLRDPPILFCDEPTTGLDSFNASNIVSLLSKLAKSGKTVVCTIHQPGSGIFENFDETILMAAGGHIAFQGNPNDALDHFKALGKVCPDTYNTAEFFISQLSTREGIRTEGEVRDICDRFHTSKAYETFVKHVLEVNTAHKDTQRLGEVNKQFLKLTTW